MDSILSIIVVVAIGLIVMFNIIAVSIFHRFVRRVWKKIEKTHLEIEKYIEENRNTVVEIVVRESKKTRKETQEIKTRLSNLRKDTNTIQFTLGGKKGKNAKKRGN